MARIRRRVMAGLTASASPASLLEVTLLFLRLGATAFGGPAAHVALIERECVRRRQWLTHDEFLDLLAVSNLIPGPTSTELAMHVGRRRAGWVGLAVAGLAFIAPAALIVGALAALYVRAGELPFVSAMLAAVHPAVLIVVLEAMLPLARTALDSGARVAIGLVACAAVLAGVSEIAVLLLAGVVHWSAVHGRKALALLVLASVPLAAAASTVAAPVAASDVFTYFLRVGSLLFGSGYVLLPVLEGDVVQRLGWLTDRQLLDAIATGQATPGPVFTTATFIGFLLGGPGMAALATAGIFLPAFVCSALSSWFFERLRRSAAARSFLAGVNAAAVALIGLVLVTLAGDALRTPSAYAILIAAAVLVFAARVNPSLVLAGSAAAGALWGVLRP